MNPTKTNTEKPQNIKSDTKTLKISRKKKLIQKPSENPTTPKTKNRNKNLAKRNQHKKNLRQM